MQVRFTLDIEAQVRLSGKYDPKQPLSRDDVLALVADVFKLGSGAIARISAIGGATIICSPEAFSRFLIKRFGFLNSFRALEAEIIEPTEEEQPRFPVIKEGYH